MRRRDFLRTTAGAAAAATLSASARAASVPPARLPVVIASENGHEFKNGGSRTAVEEALSRIVAGADPLDALVAGVEIVERDPEDDSVGYGGLPNADGVVELDASCMHGSLRRAGAVAALEGVRTPAAVARAVLHETDHHLLVGAGARTFARQMGFPVEPDLNTDRSRKKWLEWRRKIDPEHWLEPGKRSAAADRARQAMVAAGRLSADRLWGTIHASAMTAAGEVASVTTTSGLAFKIPGRVGDSPILGAGNWCDAAVGAAGSTGRGEANLYGLCSFLIVERMRAGAHPKDACVEALRRVVAATVETRLLKAPGRPNFQLKFYAVNRRGEHAGVALWSARDPKYAVADLAGARHVPMEALFEGDWRG